MKKILLSFSIFFTMLFTSACSSAVEETKVTRINVDEGKQMVVRYLTALVKQDSSAAEKYLTDNALTFHNQNIKNIKVSGFTIQEAEELSGAVLFRGRVFESEQGKPQFILNDIDLTMTKTNAGDYVISDINFKKRLQIGEKSNSLFLTSGTDEILLISLNDLPATYTSPTVQKEINVGKEGFGTIALSPDERNLLFTTKGQNAFLGKFNLESKEYAGIDIYQGDIAKSINWSPDGNLYALAKGSGDIILYEALGDGEYPLPGEDLFDDPKYTKSKPFFTEDNFYFMISSSDSKKKAIAGWWVYNFKSKKLGKVLK